MNFQLKPDSSLTEERIRIGKVPTLVVRPARIRPVPVGILWIHGGGYITGMKEMVYMGRGADFSRKYGATVFSPGYRLAWMHPYPAAVDDCFEVLQYMDENRQKLGFERIMGGGESAGGGLCAAVCMMARDKGIHIAFQMPLYPMLSNLDTESSRDNHGRVWNTRRNHLGWHVYLRRNAKKAVAPYASPSQQSDYRNLPPCYSFVGEGEPFYTETLQYVRNLQTAGVEAAADVYATNMHAFDMLQPETSISMKAKDGLFAHFEYALEHYY